MCGSEVPYLCPRAETPEHGEDYILVLVMKWIAAQEGTPGRQGLMQWEHIKGGDK